MSTENTIRLGKAKFSPEEIREKELLSSLIHRVGHDIGNPLTSVISLATIIDRFSSAESGGLEPEKTASYARSIVSEAWRVNSLTEKLVLLLSSRVGNPVANELKPLLHRALDRLETRRGFDSDWVRILIDSPAPLTAVFDADQMQVLITELIENAFQAVGAVPTAESSKEPPLTPPIQVRLAEDNNVPVFEVITLQDAPSPHEPCDLFNPFVTTWQDDKHLGIGLTVALSIALRHNAEIEIEEKVIADGYHFTTRIRFPNTTANNTLETPKATPTPQATAKKEAKESLSFVIVDDEPMVASAITKILEMSFAEESALTVLSLSGDEAISHIERGDPIDIMLCDLNLSGMSGRHVFETLCEFQPKAVSGFAFITGEKARPETELYLKSSNRPYLLKPFEPEQLIELVRTLLS